MRRLRTRRSIILCYHGVGTTSARIDPGFLRVSPTALRAQLQLLGDAGFEFVTVAEFAERADGRQPPPGLIALSFDDGMDDNHSILLPMLQELGLPATVYVATGLMGKPNPWLAEDSGARMMTAHELRDLAAAGVEIGAHSVTHPDLSLLGFEACLREARESKLALEELLGAPVRTFAYPFCRYSPAAVAAVREAGFEVAVTCEGRGTWDPYELRRTLVTGKDGQTAFVLKLARLHDPLWSLPPVRLLRAATRGFRERRRA